MITFREVKLKNLMLQMGVSVAEVTKENNCSQSLVSMYIKGTRKSEKLDKYFEELKNEYDEIMNRLYLQIRNVEDSVENVCIDRLVCYYRSFKIGVLDL